MKTNDKDIEKMAEKFAEMLDEDGTPLVDAGLFQGYKAGFKACEAKMLAEASEGFEEWYYDNVADGYRENYLEAFTSGDNVADGYRENYLEAFTSGAMSQAKRDAEELRLMSEVNRGLANRNHDLSLRARELKDAIKFLIPLAVCDAFKEVARLDEIREALKQGGER
jgi:hypothetical protein